MRPTCSLLMPFTMVTTGTISTPLEYRFSIGRLGSKLRALGEFEPVGGRLHRGITHLPRVMHGIQEVGRERRLSARELHRHLAFGLDGNGIIEQRLDVFPAQLVYEAHL